jgi:hypothetical protein
MQLSVGGAYNNNSAFCQSLTRPARMPSNCGMPVLVLQRSRCDPEHGSGLDGATHLTLRGGRRLGMRTKLGMSSKRVLLRQTMDLVAGGDLQSLIVQNFIIQGCKLFGFFAVIS